MNSVPERQSRFTILVVDDDWLNRELFEGMLQAGGFEVILANSGPRALEQLKTHQPDAAIVDIRMPDMDGFALCRALRDQRHTRDLPVLLVTALEIDAPLRAQAAAAGAQGVIKRKTTVDALEAEIRQLLR
ncbi:MAG: response regulator [Chloroflexota bacterium]